MPYKYIEHTADIAVEVYGASINELFISACDAWLESVSDNENRLRESSKKFIFNSVSLEELLVDLLSELNFHLYTKKWCFVSVKDLLLQETRSGFQLEAEVFGQKFNSKIHKLKVEIKAVTFHQMKIEKKGNFYYTRIIFDI